jgi:hypothetical protein
MIFGSADHSKASSEKAAQRKVERRLQNFRQASGEKIFRDLLTDQKNPMYTVRLR